MQLAKLLNTKKSRINSIIFRYILLIIPLFVCAAPVYAQVDVAIKINGVNDEIATNIRLFLSLEQQKGHTLFAESRVQLLYDKSINEIKNALQPYGYYRPKIDNALKKISDQKWEAVYTIDPGPALAIANSTITLQGEIKTDPVFLDLLKNTPLHEGDKFTHIQYEKFKAKLTEIAAERGYFKAEFSTHRVEIDLKKYTASIFLEYNGGIRYKFGDVVTEQNVLKPDLFDRYIPFKKGDPYSLSMLIELKQALNDSDYFQIVDVSPGKPQDASTEVPVNVSLTPRKRHRYLFGLGYGTDTGARTKIGWTIPRVNDSGHRFSSEIRVSEVGYSVSTTYSVPVLNPQTDKMIYSAGIIDETTDTSESTIRTIGAALNRNRGAWRESLAINYQQEEYVVANDRGDSVLLIPGASWSRIWGHDNIYTLDGLRFDISARGASQSIISDTDFFQAQSGIKVISSAGDNNRLIARGRFGSTVTDEFHQLPTSVRFFAGGSQSVRGYSYQSLGPVDSSGKVVGGRHLMVGSIEFERRLDEKWSWAIFYDAGNAIDNLSDKLERGAGFGIRWQSPIGPIRFDVASAVSRDGNPWRLHINIGPDL